jgi:hypothetical protein
MQNNELVIFDLIKSNAAVATDDGDKLFKIIAEYFEKNETVTLDFIKLKSLTSTFLNAAIGQLYSKYDSPFIQAHLKVNNLSPEDTYTMKKVVERAKQYFINKQSIEKPVKDVMNEEHDN